MRPFREPRPIALLVMAVVGACSASVPAPAPVAPAAPPGVEHDVCEASPPLPHAPLSGVLRNARCDQDMYYSMSQVADMLGVDCTYCHAAKIEGQKPRDFPVMTPRKQVANWMSMELMAAIKPADGSPMKCSSCHVDDQGRPVAKILGDPRDPVKANEWMNLVMVTRFVAVDGSKLKCKSCHVGAPGTPGFHRQVILKSEQLPSHTTAAKGTPAF
jgi:hypothetical protein